MTSPPVAYAFTTKLKAPTYSSFSVKVIVLSVLVIKDWSKASCQSSIVSFTCKLYTKLEQTDDSVVIAGIVKKGKTPSIV